MSTERSQQHSSSEERAAVEARPSGSAEAAEEAPATAKDDPRYASQAAAAKPSPVAFEGGAGTPSESGGTTRRREWVFLVLAVFFSVAFISAPALLFTSIDLTDAGSTDGAAAGDGDASQRRQLLQETRADALSKLYTYGPAEETGAYRIPVEQAMRLTLQEDYDAGAGSAEAAPGAPAMR